MKAIILISLLVIIFLSYLNTGSSKDLEKMGLDIKKYYSEDFLDAILGRTPPQVPPSLAMSSIAPKSFGDAQQLAYEIHDQKEKSFYCECDWEVYLKQTGYLTASMDTGRCGFRPRSDYATGSRLRWRHVVPMNKIGKNLQCWSKGGVDSCRATNPEFNMMEADLFNLVPVANEIANDKENFTYGYVNNKRKYYGKCDVRIDFNAKVFEPRDSVKGDIARIHWHMAKIYNLDISEQEKKILVKWDNDDPVSKEECLRNERIKKHMGAGNQFVENQCLHK